MKAFVHMAQQSLSFFSRFLNQTKPLSETDHLLGLNKCLPTLEQKKTVKNTVSAGRYTDEHTHRDSWTFHL